MWHHALIVISHVGGLHFSILARQHHELERVWALISLRHRSADCPSATPKIHGANVRRKNGISRKFGSPLLLGASSSSATYCEIVPASCSCEVPANAGEGNIAHPGVLLNPAAPGAVVLVDLLIVTHTHTGITTELACMTLIVLVIGC